MTFAAAEYWVYVLLIAGCAAGLYAWYLSWKSRVVRKLFPGPGTGDALVPRARRAAIAKNALVFVSIMLAAFVMLRPQWGERDQEGAIEGADVLVALDVSRSMDAQDVNPSRLARAKNAVRLLAESARGGRIGLVLFAGDAYVQCPLTGDIDAFLMFLNSVDTGAIRRQGTDVGRALEASARVFERRRLTARTLVLISDGEDHEGGADAGAERLKELGVTVFTVGVGTEAGAVVPLDDRSALSDHKGGRVRSSKSVATLERIAERTGGECLDITGGLSDMKVVMGALDGSAKTERGRRTVSRKIDRYHGFALALLALLSIEALIPDRRRI